MIALSLSLFLSEPYASELSKGKFLRRIWSPKDPELFIFTYLRYGGPLPDQVPYAELVTLILPL